MCMSCIYIYNIPISDILFTDSDMNIPVLLYHNPIHLAMSVWSYLISTQKAEQQSALCISIADPVAVPGTTGDPSAPRHPPHNNTGNVLIG